MGVPMPAKHENGRQAYQELNTHFSGSLAESSFLGGFDDQFKLGLGWSLLEHCHELPCIAADKCDHEDRVD